MWPIFSNVLKQIYLNVYLGAVRSDILGSCRKPSSVKDNLSAVERGAMKDLTIAQADGRIQIKPVDKGGGMAVMNVKDYLLRNLYLNPQLTDYTILLSV